MSQGNGLVKSSREHVEQLVRLRVRDFQREFRGKRGAIEARLVLQRRADIDNATLVRDEIDDPALLNDPRALGGRSSAQ